MSEWVWFFPAEHESTVKWASRAQRVAMYYAAVSRQITGNRANGIIIDDPHNSTLRNGETKMSTESEVYKSSTHGPIKLSFTARCLMHNLRGAITRAIARGEWTDARNEVSHARGELAKHISDLEANRPSSIGDSYANALGEVLGKIRALFGLPLGGSVIEAVEAVVRDCDLQRQAVTYWRGEWDKAEKSRLHALNRNVPLPPPIFMQQSVTDAQLEAVWQKLRAKTLSAERMIGLTRSECDSILRDVFNLPKDPLPAGNSAQSVSGPKPPWRTYGSF